MPVSVPCPALVGGNCNNGFHVGCLALNVNNAVSNANWNIGAATSYKNGRLTKGIIFLHRRRLKYRYPVEIAPIKGMV